MKVFMLLVRFITIDQLLAIACSASYGMMFSGICEVSHGLVLDSLPQPIAPNRRSA